MKFARVYSGDLSVYSSAMAYYITPIDAPADYPPWYCSSRDYADYLKAKLEHEYRNRFDVQLTITDDGEPRVLFSYPPAYLFSMSISEV